MSIKVYYFCLTNPSETPPQHQHHLKNHHLPYLIQVPNKMSFLKAFRINFIFLAFINQIKIIKTKIWENNQAWDRRKLKTLSPRPHWLQERPQRKNGLKERKRKRKISVSFLTMSSSKISSKRPLKWDSSLQPF